MKKIKSIAANKIIQTAIATVVVIAGTVMAVQSLPRMDVDGVTCTTFSQCRALADAGSVWTFVGDWSSSGKLSVPNNNIFLAGENATIQYATVSGNGVEMYGFEVTKSPVGVNGIFWTGEDGFIHDIDCHDSGLTCIRLYTSSNTVVKDSKTYDNRRGPAGNSDGINCDGGSNNSFIGNEMSNNGDDGLDTWKCKGSTVKFNNAHHQCGGGDENGFKLGPGGGGLVEGNTASYNCNTGFASNEGGNTFKNNTADHNVICGFCDWRGAVGGVQYSVYIGNVAYANGVDFKISAPAQYVQFDKGNTTAVPTGAATDAPTLTPTETATTVPSATPTASATETPEPTAIPTGTPIVIFCDKPCKIIIEEK